MKPSIIRRLILANFGFGFTMGLIFPVYAHFFVDWKPGLFPFFAAGCIVAGSVIGLVNYLFLRAFLLRPLDRIRDLATRLKRNDFTGQIHLASADAVGDIAGSLDGAILELDGVLREVKSLGLEALRHAKDASATASKADRRSQETLRGFRESATQAAQAALDQASRAEAAAARLGSSFRALSHNLEGQAQGTRASQTEATALHQSIQGGAKGIAALLEGALRTREESERGRATLEGLVSAIGELSRAASLAQARSAEFQKKSEKINSILSAIDSVAHQIKLLSLNASIEAAKAGAQGKGFSVVAGEIKQLAGRTVSSVEAIGAVIAGVREDAKAVAESMGIVHGKVEETARGSEAIERMVEGALGSAIQTGERVQAVGKDLDDIARRSTALQEQHRLGAALVDGSRQQIDGIRDLMDEIQRLREAIAAMAERSKGLGEESSALASGIGEAFAELAANVRHSETSAQRLGQTVERFQVRESPATA